MFPALLVLLPCLFTDPGLPPVLTTDAIVSGRVELDSLTVRPGTTLWADGPLELVVGGALVIEGDVRVLPGGEPGSDGAWLSITSRSGVVVRGTLAAGDGAPGLSAGEAGGRGGSISVRAPVVTLATDLVGARGGHGGPGGDGGAGGDVHVHGRVVLLPGVLPAPLLRGGAGGAGGDGGRGRDEGAGSAEARHGGRGGDGGWALANDGQNGVAGTDNLLFTPAGAGSPGTPCNDGGGGGQGAQAVGGQGGPGGDGESGLPFSTGGDGGNGGRGGHARGQDGGVGGTGGSCCVVVGAGGDGGNGGSGGNGFGGNGGQGGDGGPGIQQGAGGNGGNGGNGTAGDAGDGGPGGPGVAAGAGGAAGTPGVGDGGNPGPPGFGSPPGQSGTPGQNIPGQPGVAGAGGGACSAWAQVGPGKTGLFGLAPQLTGSGPLSGGSANAVDLSFAYPQSSAALVLGFGYLGLPYKDGVIHPTADLVVPGIPTGVSGALSLPFTWPGGLPPDPVVYLQFWVTDPSASFGLSASNGLRALGQ